MVNTQGHRRRQCNTLCARLDFLTLDRERDRDRDRDTERARERERESESESERMGIESGRETRLEFFDPRERD